MRTLQTVNAEYFQTAAVIGEKVMQINNTKVEVLKLTEKLSALFSEIQIHKAAQSGFDGSPPPAPAPPPEVTP